MTSFTKGEQYRITFEEYRDRFGDDEVTVRIHSGAEFLGNVEAEAYTENGATVLIGEDDAGMYTSISQFPAEPDSSDQKHRVAEVERVAAVTWFCAECGELLSLPDAPKDSDECACGERAATDTSAVRVTDADLPEQHDTDDVRELSAADRAALPDPTGAPAGRRHLLDAVADVLRGGAGAGRTTTLTEFAGGEQA